MEEVMITFRSLRASALCLCLFTVAAHAQTPETRMLDGLHSALALTPAQEDGWKAFTQAYAIDPQELTQRRNSAATIPTLTAPQRVDLSVSMMKADLDSMERRGAALKAFYATLSPQQQSTFDRDTLPPPQQGPY
jgi:periplasmic protein CpxP/Spy